MFLVLQKFQQFKQRWTLEQIYNASVAGIIFLILVIALLALYRPISAQQQQSLYVLAAQEHHPESQKIALSFIGREKKISVGQYLKLMHVYQYEEKRARTLPAYVIEE
jgi:flagellar biosynthesis/type III secretory pathway M-ring protein FliF/YscJ